MNLMVSFLILLFYLWCLFGFAAVVNNCCESIFIGGPIVWLFTFIEYILDKINNH